MIPDATGRPASAASSTLGSTPTPTTTRSAGTCRPSLRLTPGTLVAVALDAGGLHAEMDADTGRGVPVLKIFRDFRGHRARHDARAEFDHVHLEALGARGGGEFQADEAGADHDDASGPARSAAAAPRSRRACADSARRRDWRWEYRAGDCARRWPAPDGRSRAKSRMRAAALRAAAIDRDGAIGDQLDVLVAIEFVRPEHQAVGSAFALQIGLRQRRPLIRQMGFIVEQADALAKAMLAQRCRELKARMTGTDDNDRSLRHRDNPTASAQELPMSSPLSPILCLPASSLGERRSWPHPEGWGHHLASWLEAAQERPCPGGRLRRHFARLDFARLRRDCHLFPSAI